MGLLPPVPTVAAMVAHGCVICRGPAELHHLPYPALGKKSDKMIPLCAMHHRLGNRGIAVHAGRKSFEKNYGSEEDLYLNLLEELSCRITRDS